MIISRSLRVLALAAGLALPAAAVAGPSILDSWTTVPMPPPPEIKPVSVDSAHTALLLLDFLAPNCTDQQRPRCVKTLPALQKLLADARAHKIKVIYSAGAVTPTSLPPDPAPAIARQDGEAMVRAPVDKFYNSDLEKMLKDGGITTVIVTGTSAEGAVLSTASSAAIRGLTVIVPLDGMSSVNPFRELYTAWHLRNAPAALSSHVTLTTTDKITMK